MDDYRHAQGIRAEFNSRRVCMRGLVLLAIIVAASWILKYFSGIPIWQTIYWAVALAFSIFHGSYAVMMFLERAPQELRKWLGDPEPGEAIERMQADRMQAESPSADLRYGVEPFDEELRRRLDEEEKHLNADFLRLRHLRMEDLFMHPGFVGDSFSFTLGSCTNCGLISSDRY
jgi:hypothetical protein